MPLFRKMGQYKRPRILTSLQRSIQGIFIKKAVLNQPNLKANSCNYLFPPPPLLPLLFFSFLLFIPLHLNDNFWPRTVQDFSLFPRPISAAKSS